MHTNELEGPLEQETAGPALVHGVDTAAASEERSKPSGTDPVPVKVAGDLTVVWGLLSCCPTIR